MVETLGLAIRWALRKKVEKGSLVLRLVGVEHVIGEYQFLDEPGDLAIG